MPLPTPECFRGLDILDQLDSLYGAALKIGQGGSFTPIQIAGLQGWWKEDGLANDGGFITQWDDSSGNDNTLLPINEAPQFSSGFLNGLNVATFFGVDGSSGTPLAHGSPLMSG